MAPCLKRCISQTSRTANRKNRTSTKAPRLKAQHLGAHLLADPRALSCLLADLCVMSRVVLVEFTKSVDRALSCLLADLGPPASLSTSSPTLLCLGTLNRGAHLLAGGEDPDRALSYLLTDPPPRQDRTSSPTLTTARRCSDSRQRSRYACSKQRRSKRLKRSNH